MFHVPKCYPVTVQNVVPLILLLNVKELFLAIPHVQLSGFARIQETGIVMLVFAMIEMKRMMDDLSCQSSVPIFLCVCVLLPVVTVCISVCISLASHDHVFHL